MEQLERSKQSKAKPDVPDRDINTPVGPNLNPIGRRPPSGNRKSQTGVTFDLPALEKKGSSNRLETGLPKVSSRDKMKPLSRKVAAKTAQPSKNLAQEMLDNLESVQTANAKKKADSLGMRLIDDDLNDMLSMARNTKTAV